MKRTKISWKFFKVMVKFLGIRALVQPSLTLTLTYLSGRSDQRALLGIPGSLLYVELLADL